MNIENNNKLTNNSDSFELLNITRPFVLSSDNLKTRYETRIFLDEMISIENIIEIFTRNIQNKLITEGLLEDYDIFLKIKENFHIHDVSLLDIIKSNIDETFYICDHCNTKNPVNKVDCSKVYVYKSHLSNEESFDGVFASCDIKEGEVVEKGIVRTVNIEGMECPHVFTWSNDIPNKIWAIGSGCSTFYNTAKTDIEENVLMKRYFKENRFEIIAKRDIYKGEELFHKYKSLQWRTVFRDI